MQYPTDCEEQKEDFRRRKIALSAERWHELSFVNREVNQDITPEQKVGGILTARWLVSPRVGDCSDYAVTKRHMLLANGWPSRSLLLAEVVTNWGEHHLVLVVRLSDMDVVLDNLDANVWPATMTSYEWVRMESPHNPKFWSAVKAATTVSRITMLGH
jgi:predicted transglutaminase-like cysteine proteinase